MKRQMKAFDAVRNEVWSVFVLDGGYMEQSAPPSPRPAIHLIFTRDTADCF